MNVVQQISERRPRTSTTERHRELAARLVDAAEAVIAQAGLAGLRARDLAEAAGCSVGAIYGVFPTLDALIMAVNDRTLSALQDALDRQTWPDDPAEQLAGFASSYLAFAAAHPARWAALFQHRLPPDQTVAADYAARQDRLFTRVAEPIARLCPHLPQSELPVLSRTLFSAVHGVVQLGLEQKLADRRLPELHLHLRWIVETITRGLQAPRPR